MWTKSSWAAGDYIGSLGGRGGQGLLSVVGSFDDREAVVEPQVVRERARKGQHRTCVRTAARGRGTVSGRFCAGEDVARWQSKFW